jgi:hypothetical protein
MAADTSEAKQHAHQLLDQLGPGQIAAVVRLLEIMVHPDDEPLTEEDRRAVAASREWFENNPEGISFEQVVADCGLAMEDIKNHKGD